MTRYKNIKKQSWRLVNEKFQVLLDNARETVLSTLNKIEKNEI